MITYCPETIKPGESDALISQTDYYASFASLLNISLDKKEAVDSQNVLNALLNYNSDARQVMLEESLTLSLRYRNWKYIMPFRNKPIPNWFSNKKIETGFDKTPQLYNLNVDINEQLNVASKNKDLTDMMQSKIDSIVKAH